MRAMILTADPFEDSELIVPYDGLGREGLAVDTVNPVCILRHPARP